MGRARILVIASHSEGMIADLCNKAILLEQGRMIAFGDVGSVFAAYNRLNDDFTDSAAE